MWMNLRDNAPDSPNVQNKSKGLVILLEEYSYVAGSASALTQFVVNIVGSAGTALATMGWHSMINGVGIITLGFTALAAICWAIIVSRKYLKKRLDE